MKAQLLAIYSILFVPATLAALRANKALNEEIFHADDTKDDRRTPFDAPSNANQAAYARLMNERDVISGKRLKGAGLAADGIDSVVIRPEEIMNDGDPELMTSSASGDRSSMTTEEAYKEEEEYDEEFIIREVMAATEGEEYANQFFSQDSLFVRRLNYDTGLTSAIGDFQPLECNLGADNSSSLPSAEECDADPDGFMSTLVDEAGNGVVVIPCGQCIKVSIFGFSHNISHWTYIFTPNF